MASNKEKKMLESLLTEDEKLTMEEVDRRTAIAKMHQLELNVNKEYIEFQSKLNNICRIDAAIGEFDKFLIDFVEMLEHLPDTVQGFIPECTTEQYAKIQQYIDDQLQMLSQKKLHLTIESTSQEKAQATAAKVASQIKTTKMKGL